MFHAREKQKKKRGIPEAKLLLYVLKFFSFVLENSAQQEERRSRDVSRVLRAFSPTLALVFTSIVFTAVFLLLFCFLLLCLSPLFSPLKRAVIIYFQEGNRKRVMMV